jgi:uncharacterized protein (DUF427 family)
VRWRTSSDQLQPPVSEGNHYFPPDSVNAEFVRPSKTTNRCPWKGTANYYSLVVDGRTNEDAAWYYPEAFCRSH